MSKVRDNNGSCPPPFNPSSNGAAPGRVWWRWAVVLAPGVLLYFFALPGLNTAQGACSPSSPPPSIALVAQPVRMGVSVLLAMTLLALTVRSRRRQECWPVRQRHGLARVHRVPVFARRHTDRFRYTRRLTGSSHASAAHPCAWGIPSPPPTWCWAPFIPVGHRTRRRCRLSHHSFRRQCLRLRTGPHRAQDRGISGARLLPHHLCRLAMFLTGWPPNPLIAEFARKIGHVELTWDDGCWDPSCPVSEPFRLCRGSCSAWSGCKSATPKKRVPWRAANWRGAVPGTAGALAGREHLGVMAGWVSSPWHGVSNTFVALSDSARSC